MTSALLSFAAGVCFSTGAMLAIGVHAAWTRRSRSAAWGDIDLIRRAVTEEDEALAANLGRARIASHP